MSAKAKLAAMKARAAEVRKEGGLSIEWEGFKLRVLAPTIGETMEIAEKGTDSIPVYDLMRSFVVDEEGEHVFKEATDGDLAAFPADLLKSITAAVERMNIDAEGP